MDVTRIANPSPSDGAGFGKSVAGIGDVNGDGFPDLVIGSPEEDKIRVISGKDHSVLHTVGDPDNLSSFQFGFSVIGVGDWDGDGKDDFAVSAPGQQGLILLPCLDPCPVDPKWGRVFIISGATGTVLQKIVPPEETLLFGFAIALLGDVNGDGKPDFAIGAPILQSFIGSVYAISGLDGSQIWKASESGAGAGPKQPIATFGARLAMLHDINGDGKADLLVGAPFHDDGSNKLSGAAYVLSGANGSFIRSHTVPQVLSKNNFGVSVTNLGDQNGDGKDDYMVGDSLGNLAHLYSGADGSLLNDISAPASSQGFGFAVATVSDYDHDGKNDFWIGAYQTDRVYLMNKAGAKLLEVADPMAGNQSFGQALATTKDLGGDSGLDVLVGAPNETSAGAATAGAAYVITVHENRPPVAKAGDDQTIECDRNGIVTLDGSASSDPDGDPITFDWKQISGTAVSLNVSGAIATFTAAPPGVYTFRLTVTDDKGASSTDDVTVTIRDTAAPTLSVSLSPDTLWPPNHNLVDIAATITVSDACDANPSVVLSSISSNEPADSTGDGNTSPDIAGATVGTDDRFFQLRAERKGNGAGRVYIVTYTASDATGNTSSQSGTVKVPHN